MSWSFRWKPYVPVARRQANARKHAEKHAKKRGQPLQPIKIEGRIIATTFWGKAWCENLERYSDYANRLPRGRTYVRNGSVIDLRIQRGQVDAIVSGSEIYTIRIKIETVKSALWNRLKKDCAGSIGSLMDLLTGKLNKDVMARLAQKDGGLFPCPKEISMKCSCPDWAGMCKHLAAVLYGIGSRLDSEPELLFTLRDVDHVELIGQAVSAENLEATLRSEGSESLQGQDLGAVFGIELSNDLQVPTQAPANTILAEKKKSKVSRAVSGKPTNPQKRAAKKRAMAASKKPVRAVNARRA